MRDDTDRAARLRAIAQWLAALGEATRLAIILELAGGERAAGDVAAAVGESLVNASHHLVVLRRGGLAAMTPSGRYRWYRLVGAAVTPRAVELTHPSGARVVLDRPALASVRIGKGAKV